MTKRLDVSYTQNLFHNAQRVDQEDLALEQNHNNQTIAAVVNNFFGSGILLSAPQTNIIFDSDALTTDQTALESANNFDGAGIQVHTQPTDTTQGNQLEIELTGSSVIGRISTKVAIIGLSFDNKLQIDKLYFYRNEKQYTSKHYKQILSIFFSDFKGNTFCSRNNGGRIIIREAQSFQLSRDAINTEQISEPDIFWRDWKTPSANDNIFDIIQTGIGPEYNADALEINITGRDNRKLLANDVTSAVGQKFKSNTDNIQKITVLLGVEKDDSEDVEDYFDWNGDLIISVYPLQSSISCPSDIVPELAIDFDPTLQPIAQISFNYDTLKDNGYILNNVLQPVDFVFSGGKIASSISGAILKDKYYAFTLKRSGGATIGNIIIGAGNNRNEESRTTLFSTVWIDVPEEELWYQVWTDAAKIASGQAYDQGNGIQYDKVITDSISGIAIDNESRYLSFVDTGYGVVNNGLVQAVAEQSLKEQDERSGNDIFAREKYVPSFSFISNSDLNTLQNVSEPLVVGAAFDLNPKLNPVLEKIQTYPGTAREDKFIIVNPDPDLLNLNLIGSKLIPNIESSLDYKIVKVDYCRNYYGDIMDTGTIDATDLARMAVLVGESIYSISTQEKIRDGEISLLELLRADLDADGYITSEDSDLLAQYINRQISSFPAGTYFTNLEITVQQSIGRYDGYYDCTDGYIRLDGYNGLNIIDSDTLTPVELEYDGYNILPQLNLDPAYTTVPFESLTYRIKPLPYWSDNLLKFTTEVKLLPCNFSYNDGVEQYSCQPETATLCEDRSDLVPTFDAGRNDIFIPNNILIGDGQLLNQDLTHHKIDFEIYTMIFELPETALNNVSINVFQKIIKDRGDGNNLIGRSCAKYADCSTVQAEDLAAGKIRFNVSVQSLNKLNDGYSEDDENFCVIVDERVGVHMDQQTGILTLNAKNLDEDEVLLSLVTRIQIIAYLKRGGFNNNIIEISSNEVEGLISS